MTNAEWHALSREERYRIVMLGRDCAPGYPEYPIDNEGNVWSAQTFNWRSIGQPPLQPVFRPTVNGPRELVKVRRGTMLSRRVHPKDQPFGGAYHLLEVAALARDVFFGGHLMTGMLYQQPVPFEPPTLVDGQSFGIEKHVQFKTNGQPSVITRVYDFHQYPHTGEMEPEVRYELDRVGWDTDFVRCLLTLLRAMPSQVQYINVDFSTAGATDGATPDHEA